MSQLDRNTVTQFLSPRQRLRSAWHTAADEARSTGGEVTQAPRATRAGAFGQHLHTPGVEHCDEPDLAA
jgi:hypothetical protein